MEYETGRPRVYTGQSTPMEASTYRLTSWHKRIARRLGDGNEAEGVRIALEKASFDMPPDALPKPKRNDDV